LAAGQTDTITFAFSGAVTGFDLSDVSVTGGALSNLQPVAGDPTHYTAIFTPAAGVNTQTAQIQVLAGGWTDVAGNTGTASTTLSIVEDTATLTIDSGTTTEIGAASAATIDFANGSGISGELVLDDSKDFTGQIVGFTGDGTATNSDWIDLKDISFTTATETYTENSARTGGTLTITDGTNTANINFTGNYVLNNFKFSADGSGGTLIIDPPLTEGQNTTETQNALISNQTGVLSNAACLEYSAATAVLTGLINTVQDGEGNALTVLASVLSQLESGYGLELNKVLAADVSGQQLQQLVQVLTDGQTPITNDTPLVEDLASGYNRLVKIDSGETLEIGAPSTGNVIFDNGSGTNGNLVLDDSKDFTAQIVGFTGDGTVANSDTIDVRDINFASATEAYTENRDGTGGTLTITDATNTANINFTGEYVLANFKFSADGSGGTLIIDPPVNESQNTSVPNLLSTDVEDPSTQTLGNTNDTSSAQNGSAVDVLFNIVQHNVIGHGEAPDVILNLINQFESANKPTDDTSWAQHGTGVDAIANLIDSFEHGQGNATDAITNLASQFENASKLELDNLLAAHGNELQQLQELVQGLTDGHNPLTNTGQLQQLAQDLASGHNPLINSGEDIIHLPQIDPHHGFIHT